jgi:hypothetical protein
MKTLMSAWAQGGEAEFLRKWAELFRPGSEATKPMQQPIRIAGDTGDCAERALEVIGAPDSNTRVSAEWWYLYYTFGRSWKPEVHSTRGDGEGTHFSVHDIHVFPDSHLRVFFRLPW